MSTPELKTRRQLVTDAVRRMVTYTDQITWFGPNSVGLAMAKMVAGQTSTAYRLYKSLIRRQTLLASSGDNTTMVAEEKGAPRLDAQRARVLIIVMPRRARVTAITLGATDLIEVDDSTDFAAADSLRIRSADGATTEAATIIAVTIGTGPNGNDELEVAALGNAYAPLTQNVSVLRRLTLAASTVFGTTSGTTFESLAALTIGDGNPVMDGESTFLGLSDKVWCECVTAGAVGNIDPDSVTGLAVPVAGVVKAYNPERGIGGDETETDFDLKYRASHGPAQAGQETAAWIEAIARKGDSNALRAVVVPTTVVSTLACKVIARNGGPLSAAAKAGLEVYIGDRVRSNHLIDIQDLSLTSVEVSAQCTLDPDADLREVWKTAASSLAAHMDYRKWVAGTDVDEADLLGIVNKTTGIATLTTSTFEPAANVAVADDSYPTLVKLTLEDTDTVDILGAFVTVAF